MSEFELIKLNLNECVYKHPWTIDFGTVNINRYFNIEHSSLKNRLATMYNVERKNITITSGSDEAIKLVIDTIKPQCIYKYNPSYDIIETFYNGKIYNLEIPKRSKYISTEFYNIQENSIIYLCNPNNPTNDLWTEDEIFILANKYPSTFIIVDEAYAEFEDTISNDKSCIYNLPNLIFIRTFSKAYGLAGLRIGYIISYTEYQKNYNFKQVTEIANICANNVLDNIEFYKDIVNRIKYNRDIVMKNSHGNFVYLQLSSEDKTSLIKELKDKYNILIREKYSNSIRITIPLSLDLSENIRDIIQKYNQIDIRSYYTPIEIRLTVLSMFREFVKNTKCYWFLDSGSFLGCVRDNEIIRWDDDIDIGVINITLEDIDDLRKYFRVERNRTDKYWQICDKNFKQHPNKTIHIDIFPFIKNEEGLWVNNDERFRGCSDTDKGFVNFDYKDDELFPLKQSKFYDINVFVPNKKIPDSFLNTYIIKTDNGPVTFEK